MPYKNIRDLPTKTKVLPIAAQKIWLNVFNYTYTKTKNEEEAARKAWAAVERTYAKNENGSWVKLKNQIRKE